MTSKIVLLDLMGGVALLLWGMHMVQTGIVRAFGASLRRFLSRALGNRAYAFLVGLCLTFVLQSSTATGLMVTSFAASGLVTLPAGLAVMLGANVGSALIVQALSFNVSALAPLLLILGVTAFRRSSQTLYRDLGRVAIGLGLIFLSLHILLDTLQPAEEVPAVRQLMALVTQDPFLDVLFGAVLAWAAHSSVAVVLLVASLAFSHFVGPPAALALVLGANLGSAVNPLLESAGLEDPAKRRLPMGNLVNRLLGCALIFPWLTPISHELGRLVPDPVRQVALFHTSFNVAVAAVFIVLLDPMARLLERMLPTARRPANPATPLYLDPLAVQIPSAALTCAARETLHMGDIVENMLRQSMAAVMKEDRKLVSEIGRMDNAVDKLHEAIKLYVIEASRGTLDERDTRRAMEIISFVINLEHIGDIIDKNLMELAAKKIKGRLSFSAEGALELRDFHSRVVSDLALALGVFISGDAKIARQLLEGKAWIRQAEREASEHHLERLREGRMQSIETSSLHLDILRDLKRIHYHICSVAYPVLEREAASARHSPASEDELDTDVDLASGDPALE